MKNGTDQLFAAAILQIVEGTSNDVTYEVINNIPMPGLFTPKKKLEKSKTLRITVTEKEDQA